MTWVWRGFPQLGRIQPSTDLFKNVNTDSREHEYGRDKLARRTWIGAVEIDLGGSFFRALTLTATAFVVPHWCDGGCGSQLLVRMLITVITANITAGSSGAAIDHGRRGTAARVTAAGPTAAGPTARVTNTIDTARRRNAAGRRRRRSATAADSVIAAPVIAAPTPRTIALCLGERGDGGGSECESRRGHDGYPAKFRHHDMSPGYLFWRRTHLEL
jgi:hypothetical protein